MRLIDADKLEPDCISSKRTFAISQSQIANAPTVDVLEEFCEVLRDSGLFVSNWIPVSERLPDEGQTVIASTEYGVYGEARYTKEYGWEWPYEAGADYWKELDGVTAWIPLPKRYEPQESEEKENG